MARLTPWFPKTVRPVNVGVYRIGPPFFGEWYKFWDGKRWWDGGGTAYDATIPINAESSTSVQDCVWRGLATKPKASHHG